ncbi:3'-5' exonuclease [Deinococcus ruber]|uniref:Exonuclease domain-containing protein n=1 Tax=Deinococcus ruber TaxID=1848197 RepID=A0A918F7R9_9DEIO|nr:hypothetical protein [Deinococcus ruber]GGR13291.1 hypothetical protein GCM10008957_27810 [Deinococcus ruber]
MNQEHDIQQAIRTFRRWARDEDALVLDTETTGLYGQVWDVAALSLTTLEPRVVFVCQPEGAWEPKARELHAARLDEILQAPPAAKFRQTLATALQAVPLHSQVLTYGAEFDRAALLRTWPALRLPAFDCVMQAYAPLAGKWSESRGEWKWVSLQVACELEEVPVTGTLHTALGDAQLTVQLIQAVARRQLAGE